MEEKLSELFQNEEFLAKVFEMTPEDAQKEFAKEGVDITVEELNEIAVMIKTQQSGSGELDENELDSVAGGRLTLGFQYISRFVNITVPAKRIKW